MTGSDLRLGARALAIVDAINRFTDVPGQITRLYLSPAHRKAAEFVRNEMRDVGLKAQIDAAGSVIGRLEGARPGLPALLLGSHIDSVVDAGRYDGTLGVACGIVVAQEIARAKEKLPFALEVVAFGDEENIRFATDISTSRALAGAYDPAWLDATDDAGISVRKALAEFGGDPDGVLALARDPASLVGYLEVHIEQGPLLEAEKLAVGIVTAINGILRFRVRVTGTAGHAGTVPMGMRQDALAAAAEMALAVEAVGRAHEHAVATVGQFAPRPGAVNVIAGGCDFSIDFRSPDDGQRRAMEAEIVARLEAIAKARGVTLALTRYMDNPATPMDEGLRAALERAIARGQERVLSLPSGAGHDAMAMARVCPAAMLFVRCEGGISHNPAENVTLADVDRAVRVLLATVRDLAGQDG